MRHSQEKFPFVSGPLPFNMPFAPSRSQSPSIHAPKRRFPLQSTAIGKKGVFFLFPILRFSRFLSDPSIIPSLWPRQLTQTLSFLLLFSSHQPCIPWSSIIPPRFHWIPNRDSGIMIDYLPQWCATRSPCLVLAPPHPLPPCGQLPENNRSISQINLNQRPCLMPKK